MTLGIWLVPILLGFAVLRFTHSLKRSFAAKTGYEFFFTAALAGGALLVVAHLPSMLVTWLFTAMEDVAYLGPSVTWLRNAWMYLAPFDHAGVLVAAAALAVIFIKMMNRRITDLDAVARYCRSIEGGAEALLRESLENRRLVEVSTKNGRSYVGFVVIMGVQDKNWIRDVVVIPTASGYRDPETRHLTLTTNYTRLPSALRNHEVAIMMSEVATIRRFDEDVYRSVNSGRHHEPQSSEQVATGQREEQVTTPE